jgi:hypothetical protein
MKILILVLLFGLISFFFLTKEINKKDGFSNYQSFIGNIKETIFNVTTPYPKEILQKDISPPLQNFCNVYGSSDNMCHQLTNENCKSSKCCVLLNKQGTDTNEFTNETKEKKPIISNPKCVGGSDQGPTFKSDADSFYYMNKLYSTAPF